MLPQKLAFVDIETTGARSSFDRIIEIGIVRIEDGKVVGTYNSLVNPQGHIPPEITVLTGITGKDVENAPTFREVAHDILDMLEDCVFVAHNVRFDYGFLKSEFKRLGMTYTSKHFCTVKLSRALFPRFKRHNLDSIIERFGFTCENRHRALDDAQIIASFYQKMQQTLASDTFLAAVEVALKKPALPLKLTEEDLDNLPELPGVYIFYGADETPLYIGKSKNIRNRVLSHFSNDIRHGIEMKIAQQIERIDTIVTAGELGALFTESQLIKKMLPLYNRMLRLKKELIALKTGTDTYGYTTVSLETVETIDPNNLSTFVGFFRSKKQAKEYLAQLTKEHTLCEKLLGLEKSNSSCFGYRLDTCKGACIQKEQPLFYNLRATTAFFKTKIRPWPFDGPIVITEHNDLVDATEYYIVDKWCYLGSLKKDLEGIGSSRVEQEFLFDLDNYKIIERYLRIPDNVKKVRLLSPDEQQTMQFTTSL